MRISNKELLNSFWYKQHILAEKKLRLRNLLQGKKEKESVLRTVWRDSSINHNNLYQE